MYRVPAPHFLQLAIVRVLIVIPTAKVAPRFRQALVLDCIVCFVDIVLDRLIHFRGMCKTTPPRVSFYTFPIRKANFCNSRFYLSLGGKTLLTRDKAPIPALANPERRSLIQFSITGQIYLNLVLHYPRRSKCFGRHPMKVSLELLGSIVNRVRRSCACRNIPMLLCDKY
jgi:hypothetical protein